MAKAKKKPTKKEKVVKGKSQQKLTPKQLVFVDEYIVSLNATQSALNAGYSKKSASEQGYRLLRNDQISSAIQKAMNRRSKRTEITADRVLEEIAHIAFARFSDVVTWDEKGLVVIDSEKLTESAMAAISEVRETLNMQGRTITVKLHDKVAALDKLARHLMLFTENAGEDDEPVLQPVFVPSAVDGAKYFKIPTYNGPGDDSEQTH